MLWLYRYIKGYLVLEFSGEYAAKIFNLCTRGGIAMWNMRCNSQRITACIQASNFSKLRRVRKGSRIHVKILRKRGLPFFISKYRKRVGFFAGFVCFLALLYFLSGFVWTVQVNGNNKVSTAEILGACRQIGIYEGIRRERIDTKNKKEELLLKMNSLAWASLNIEGCVLTVDVREVKDKEGHRENPANLKASADGIIKRIDVKSGNCLVQIGDVVQKGDVLVSGVIERLNHTEFVHSSGIIVAQTERRIAASGGYTQKQEIETGEFFKRRVLRLFGFDIPLFVSAVKGNNNTKITANNVYLFGNKLPFSVFTKEYRPVETKDIRYDKETLTEILKRDIEKQIADCGIREYTLKNEAVSEDGDVLNLMWEITAEENIAFEEVILLSDKK